MDSVLHRHDISDRVAVTAGTVADSTRAPQLTAGIKAEAAIADKGCDSREFVDTLEAGGIEVVIPPRQNRKFQRIYDRQKAGIPITTKDTETAFSTSRTDSDVCLPDNTPPRQSITDAITLSKALMIYRRALNPDYS